MSSQHPSLDPREPVPPRGAPAIGVVICTYNVEEWIEDALASVTSQSCGRGALEIVVVDSGSTDATLSRVDRVLEAWGGRSSVVRLPNVGPSRARNVGWRQTGANWIQFLDGDDLLDPDKLATQYAAARKAGPHVAALYSIWARLRWSGHAWEPDGVYAPHIGSDAVRDLLRAENFIPTAAHLFNRSWLEAVGGFDETLWLIEDVELQLRIAMKGGAFQSATAPHSLFLYRQRAASLSGRDADEFVNACVRNARMAEDFWRQRNEMTADRIDVLVPIYLHGARHFFPTDAVAFRAHLDRIEALRPGFVPQAPPALKYASVVFGYRRAERIALAYRRVKRLLRPGRQSAARAY